MVMPIAREGFPGMAALLSCLVLALSPAAHSEKATVAVFDFDVGSSVSLESELRTDEGTESLSLERSTQSNLLTNRLIHALVQAGEVSVLEREELRRLIDEARFAQSDLADPSRAVEIGRMIGADYMIFGAITDVSPRVKTQRLPYDAGVEKQVIMEVGANARLVNSETGVVEASTEQRAKKRKSSSGASAGAVSLSRGFQQDAYSELAALMAADLMGSLNPVRVAQQSGDQVYLARANMRPGTRCRVVNEGEPVRDPDTGEVLGRMEEPVAILEVSKGMEKMSLATVVEWQAEDKTIASGSRCRPVKE